VIRLKERAECCTASDMVQQKIRGLKPRWLAAAIKSGKKPEDFLIVGAVASKANGGKKTRKAKKSAKK
jgi:hypothetical protein